MAAEVPGQTAGWRLHADGAVERRLWSIIFVTRQVGLGVAAVLIVALPDFGADRFWIAAALAFGAIPFDMWLQRTTRRDGVLPWSAVLLAAVPAALAAWHAPIWFPVIVGALASVGLFAVTVRLPVAVGLSVVTGIGLAVGGSVADVNGYAAGLTAFAVGAATLVVSASALFEAFVGAERRYDDFLEYANDMIYTHSLTDLRFLSANDAALRLTGYSRAELGAITVDEIVAPDHLERAAEMIAQKVGGETDGTTYELDILTRDGRRVPVEVSSRVIYRRGEAVAIQGIARDITERRQVEAEREALDRARGEFIANAAHELRTPLTTLAGLASVLASTRGEMSDVELEEALQALQRQGRRARTLADKLLDLSSVELGRVNVHQEPVSLVEAVDRALEDAPPPPDTSVTVEVESDVKALADPIRLQEILHNLLTNAYRYGGPTVTISGAAVNRAVLVDVCDDGDGVADELVADLFEPFSRSADGEGTGLGLTICRTLAEAQDGMIACERLEPHGSRFTVRLPEAT